MSVTERIVFLPLSKPADSPASGMFDYGTCSKYEHHAPSGCPVRLHDRLCSIVEHRFIAGNPAGFTPDAIGLPDRRTSRPARDAAGRMGRRLLNRCSSGDHIWHRDCSSLWLLDIFIVILCSYILQGGAGEHSCRDAEARNDHADREIVEMVQERG